MPLYLTRFSFTPEPWARLIANPEDRRDAAQSYIESVGGKLHGFWYAFGEHDGFTLWLSRRPEEQRVPSPARVVKQEGGVPFLELAGGWMLLPVRPSDVFSRVKAWQRSVTARSRSLRAPSAFATQLARAVSRLVRASGAESARPAPMSSRPR